MGPLRETDQRPLGPSLGRPVPPTATTSTPPSSAFATGPLTGPLTGPEAEKAAGPEQPSAAELAVLVRGPEAVATERFDPGSWGLMIVPVVIGLALCVVFGLGF